VRQLADRLVAAVAGGDRVLGALLVVDDDVHGDARAARPTDDGRRRPVPHEVAPRAGDVGVDERRKLAHSGAPYP
jgi:hypothetical protein